MHRVDGIPKQVRAKVTELINASRELAFIGSLAPEERDDVRDSYLTAKYNLERTIKTYLDRAKENS
jgi:hypothetical protein